MLHEAWHELAREWRVAIATIHPGILILPPPTRLSTADAVRIVDDLVGQTDVANRFLVWKVPTGWTELA